MFLRFAHDLIYQPPKYQLRCQCPEVRTFQYEDVNYALFFDGSPVYPSDFQIKRDEDDRKGLLIRILFFHGATQDILTSQQQVKDFMKQLLQWFNPAIRVGIVCTVIDYPGYGDNCSDRALLGTSRLDDQIETLWDMFLKRYAIDSKMYHTDCNLVWSYSIGCHYACNLLTRRHHEIDYALLTAPFHHFSESCDYMGAGLVEGYRELSGTSVLPPATLMTGTAVYAYLAGKDRIFPPKYVSPRIKEKVDEMVIDHAADHTWFDSLVGAQVVASWIGMKIAMDVKTYDEEEALDSEVVEQRSDKVSSVVSSSSESKAGSSSSELPSSFSISSSSSSLLL
jgi:hypothetical protein